MLKENGEGPSGRFEDMRFLKPVRDYKARHASTMLTFDAVVDCLIEGIIPREHANTLCIISLVWIDPRCAKDPNLDKKDMYRTNYEATKLALKRALNNEPSFDELIANRHTIKHDMDDWS